MSKKYAAYRKTRKAKSRPEAPSDFHTSAVRIGYPSDFATTAFLAPRQCQTPTPRIPLKKKTSVLFFKNSLNLFTPAQTLPTS